jgi:hypothetical protein
MKFRAENSPVDGHTGPKPPETASVTQVSFSSKSRASRVFAMPPMESASFFAAMRSDADMEPDDRGSLQRVREVSLLNLQYFGEELIVPSGVLPLSFQAVSGWMDGALRG